MEVSQPTRVLTILKVKLYFFPTRLIISIIIVIIHAEIKVALSQKCCRGTVQTAMSHITCLQSQQQ